MWKLPSLAVLTLILTGGIANALELKNVRARFAPVPFGAVRSSVKCLPGDFLFITYDIEGLKFDDKTSKANYLTVLELFDPKNALIFKKDTPNEVIPQLGGTRMPGDLHVQLGRNQKPGKYNIRLSVHDRISKETSHFVYGFDLLPSDFGILGVTAPSIGLPGQQYSCEFALVDLTLDQKKSPNVKITMKVLDEAGKAVAPAVISLLPRDLPEEINLQKENFVPMRFPIYLNRSGRFIIDISAEDIEGKKQAGLRYPLTVLDLSAK